jgi:glycerophosphoryl diester phosphodiesterase
MLGGPLNWSLVMYSYFKCSLNQVSKFFCTITAMMNLVGCAINYQTSPFATNNGTPIVLAHRGVAQTFSLEGVDKDTCTASRIYPPNHLFIENTIASILHAVELGAQVVELDIHPTVDGEFAVFHDWRLECRTDGSGVTRQQTMATLKTLDVGYGYTADGGNTFPLRGRGQGQMPTLAEAIKATPNLKLLINIKSNDANEAQLLAKYLKQFESGRLRQIAVYGAAVPIETLRSAMPDVLTMNRAALKSCHLQYATIGWFGLVPKSCQQQLILIPINLAHWLPGWPDKYISRMNQVGSAVFIVGPWSSGAMQGVNKPEQLSLLPTKHCFGLWTDDIMTIAEQMRQRKCTDLWRGIAPELLLL